MDRNFIGNILNTIPDLCHPQNSQKRVLYDKEKEMSIFRPNTIKYALELLIC